MGKAFPKDFAARRWHSIMGLFLAGFLIFHLLTNAQAAIPFSKDGSGFVHEVNWIHSLPFLHALEILALAVPFLVHGIWGVKYALSAKFNNVKSEAKPGLRKYGANHAYSWQRITAWILLIGVILHVGQMRFLRYPVEVDQGGGKSLYIVKVSEDPGLYPLAARQEVEIYDGRRILQARERFDALPKPEGPIETQEYDFERAFIAGLQKLKITPFQSLIVSDEIGKVMLFTVRNTFKSFWMMFLYAIFVAAASYHGFRGLWSFMIVWGATLTPRSQRWMKYFSIALMLGVGFLGYSAIFLSYLVTLRT